MNRSPDEVRAARKAAALTIDKLATLAGVAPSTVAFREKGLKLNAKTLDKIDAALDAALETAIKRAESLRSAHAGT